MSLSSLQRCVVCGHLDVFPKLHCTHCGFLLSSLDLCDEVEADLPAAYRAPRLKGPPPLPATLGAPLGAPLGGAQQPKEQSPSREAERQLLEAALERVGALAARVRDSQKLSAEDRAELYESLLISLLKIERQGLREGALALEREAARQRHLRHMALIGVGGWLLGVLFYFALQSV